MSYPIIGDSTVLHSPPAKNKRGPVAQLGARTVRIRKVEGSIPFGSTITKKAELLLICKGLAFRLNPSAFNCYVTFFQLLNSITVFEVLLIPIKEQHAKNHVCLSSGVYIHFVPYFYSFNSNA